MNSPERKRVAVVGAGWAGLTAAIVLADAQFEVTLYEAGRVAGGRARTVDLAGNILDNGQHLLLGAYRQSLAIMRHIGVDVEADLHRLPLLCQDPSGFSLDFGRYAWLKRLPQLHRLSVLCGAAIALREKKELIRCLLHLQRQKWLIPHAESTTVHHWLSAYDMPTLRRNFWAPLCLAALNTPYQEASAQIFANVLRDSLGSPEQGATDMLIPGVPLGALFAEPALRYLQRKGATVQLQHRVREIQYQSAQDTVSLPQLLENFRSLSASTTDSKNSSNNGSTNGATDSINSTNSSNSTNSTNSTNVQPIANVQNIADKWLVDGVAHDYLIIAVAPQHVSALIGPGLDYGYQPIATVYLNYPLLDLPQPLMSLQTGGNTQAQWLVHRRPPAVLAKHSTKTESTKTTEPSTANASACQDRRGRDEASTMWLAIVQSGNGEWAQYDNAALTQLLTAELASAAQRPQWRLNPQARQRLSQAPLQSLVVREQRATLSCTPQQQRPNPFLAPGCYLAGDYTWAEYPSALEGAVRSGQRAAQAICQAAVTA